ncbi:TPA: hypothetical protein ACSP1Y_001228 [Aeromonas hydrophila]|uniref:hypothetical protein n=1 Tax=Aeromonas hydrophila TaxID=644 RepID=UPI0038CF2C6D
MKIIPTEESAFDSDMSLKKMIKVLECYIEINHEMGSIFQALVGLYDSSYEQKPPPHLEFPDEHLEELKNIENSFAPLIEEYNALRDPFQVMRDSLWDIKRELGTYSTLMLVNSKLVMSLELLLSGVIVTYAKAFNASQRRTSLDATKIFTNKKQLDFHKYLIDLRNKHYAHSEYTLSKHTLRFMLTEDSDEINLNTTAHSWTELWSTFDYVQLFGLLETVKRYLKKEIAGKSRVIKNRLTPEQKEVLRSAYKTA